MWRCILVLNSMIYVEFTGEDVLNIEPIPEEQSSLGGSRVWLRATTTLRYTRITSQQIQADFLQGAITSGYMQARRPPSRRRVAAPRPVPPAPAITCARRTPIFQPASCGRRSAGRHLCAPNTGPFCPTGAFIHGCLSLARVPALWRRRGASPPLTRSGREPM